MRHGSLGLLYSGGDEKLARLAGGSRAGWLDRLGRAGAALALALGLERRHSAALRARAAACKAVESAEAGTRCRHCRTVPPSLPFLALPSVQTIFFCSLLTPPKRDSNNHCATIQCFGASSPPDSSLGTLSSWRAFRAIITPPERGRGIRTVLVFLCTPYSVFSKLILYYYEYCLYGVLRRATQSAHDQPVLLLVHCSVLVRMTCHAPRTRSLQSS